MLVQGHNLRLLDEAREGAPAAPGTRKQGESAARLTQHMPNQHRRFFPDLGDGGKGGGARSRGEARDAACKVIAAAQSGTPVEKPDLSIIVFVLVSSVVHV